MAAEGMWASPPAPAFPLSPLGTPAHQPLSTPSPLSWSPLAVASLPPLALVSPLRHYSGALLSPPLPGPCLLPTSESLGLRNHPYLSLLLPCSSPAPASPAPAISPCWKHPFSSPQASWCKGPGNPIKEPGLPSKAWSCHWVAAFREPMPLFWMKHRTKIWGPVGEDG